MDDEVEGEGGVADRHENAGARYQAKLNGDPSTMRSVPTRIGRELATLPYDYRVTLDANEQYADLAALARWSTGSPRRGAAADYGKPPVNIEQPTPATSPAKRPLGALARRDFHRRRGGRLLRCVPIAWALGYAASPRNPARHPEQVSDQRDARGEMERGR